MVDVHYAGVKNYLPEELYAALEKCLTPVLAAHGGASGKKVMIKPNLLEYRKEYDPASIHPELLVTLCRFLRDKGAAEIAVIENPAVRSADMIVKTMNISDRLSELGVTVKNCARYEKTGMPEKCRFHQLEIATEFRDYDLVIDFAKAKTHAMMVLTCGVKNLFGLIRGSERLTWHLAVGRNFDEFADMLLDLYLLVAPKVTLLDAVVGMEGNGPGSGDPVELGFIAASADALALDASVAKYLGVDETPVLKQAAERSILPEYCDNGDIPEVRQIKLPEPPEKKLEWGVYFPVKLRKLLRSVLLSRPVVDRKQCISCGLCAQKCPPQTLKMRNGVPKFDYIGCIRCFCCQEFCPRGAITVEKSRSLKFVSFLEKVIRKLNLVRPFRRKK